MKSGKIWGETRPLWTTPFVEVHEIVIEPYRRCSRHSHAARLNGFYCVAGQVVIKARKRDYHLTDVTTLAPGEFTVAQPGEVHWFETGEHGATVLEIYAPVPLGPSDIKRLDHGRPLRSARSVATLGFLGRDDR